MKTEHPAICACCDSPVVLQVNDDESIGWATPCPNHGTVIRIPVEVQALLIERHRAQQAKAA